MPTFTKSTEESVTHMIQPISEQVVSRLLKLLGIYPLFQDNIYFNSDDSAASKTRDSMHRPKISTNRIDIDMDYTINPNNMKWDGVTNKQLLAYHLSKNQTYEDVPILMDPGADIVMTELSRSCLIGLEVSMSLKDKEVANSIMERIISRFYTQSMIEYEDIYFDYPLHTDHLVLLYKFYKMRDIDHEAMSFLDYLKYYSSEKITLNKSRTGEDSEFVILKTQYRVLTEISMNQDKPEAVKIERVPDRFKVTFKYDIQFSRPSSVILGYPVVIDNQLIPELARPAAERFHPNDADVVSVDIAHQMYLYHKVIEEYPYPITRFPMYDDWNVPITSPIYKASFKPFFSGALLLDFDESEEPITQIDLINDLTAPFQLHPIVIDALRVQGQASFFTEGLFNIAIYANNTPVDESLLELTSDLIVKVNSTMKEKRYHIVLSEATNLSKMDPRYLPILFHYADFFGMTIIRQIKTLIDYGELVWKDGIIMIDKYRRVRLPDGSYTSSIDVTDIYGVGYSELEGYGEAMNNYLFTKKGDPILTGGPNGINCPWRIGEYIIESRR